MAEHPPSRYTELTRTFRRIIAGFLFLPHGAQKLFGMLGGMGGGGASASFPAFMWGAGVLECFGGVCMLLGVFMRPVAFLLSGQMAVAYVTAHAARGFWPLRNQGEFAVLYCVLLLFLAAVGGGPYTVARWWSKQAG